MVGLNFGSPHHNNRDGFGVRRPETSSGYCCRDRYERRAGLPDSNTVPTMYQHRQLVSPFSSMFAVLCWSNDANLLLNPKRGCFDRLLTVWDYVFTDGATGEEIGRHEFTSDSNVGPGKTKELMVTLSRPPTQRISVYSHDKNERNGLVDHVVIVAVRYADGTQSVVR